MALRSLSASALLALALTACSGGEPDAAGDAAAPEAAAPAAAAAEAAPADAAATPEAPVAEESPAAEAEKVSAATVPAVTAAPAAAEVVKVAAVAATPPAAFGRCAVCHTADKGGEDKLGPNLYGVYGKAAAKGSFAFSQQLKDAGLVLDDATLHKWLENPRALVPGNRMSFPGIKDAAKRQEIIDYLRQQS